MASKTPPAHAEHRTARRYPIIAPVSWEGGEGTTLDVSVGGAYFVTRRALAPGESVRLTVGLPRQAVCLTARATVVRVDVRPGGFGIGVRLDEVELAALAPPSASASPVTPVTPVSPSGIAPPVSGVRRRRAVATPSRV